MCVYRCLSRGCYNAFMKTARAQRLVCSQYLSLFTFFSSHLILILSISLVFPLQIFSLFLLFSPPVTFLVHPSYLAHVCLNVWKRCWREREVMVDTMTVGMLFTAQISGLRISLNNGEESFYNLQFLKKNTDSLLFVFMTDVCLFCWISSS